tara:strand:- start:38 stop:430 length:393 start_codon:yes stop_codon:yes gene_type:complete
MSKDRAIVAQCAFKGAIDLCVAEKIQMSEIMDYTYKYADAMWDKYGFESSYDSGSNNYSGGKDRPASDKQKSFVSSLFNKLTIQQQQQYKDKVDTNSMTISDASDFIQTFQDLIEKNKNTPVNLDDAPPF